MAKSKAAPKRASKRGSKPSGNAAIAVPSASGSLSIRKIQNGFIVRESGEKRGKYFERERFITKLPPGLKGGAT